MPDINTSVAVADLFLEQVTDSASSNGAAGAPSTRRRPDQLRD
jgi:hypothetical protein